MPPLGRGPVTLSRAAYPGGMTKLSVIGCGYLGAVHAAAMTSLGHEVVGIDVLPDTVASLRAGRAPFFEPGLPELLRSAVDSGRLTFSAQIADAAQATVHFIAVGTPQSADSDAADLRFVNGAVDALLTILKPGDLVVGKSTVPVGTAEAIAERISHTGAILIWNPEFLREGFAVADTLRPDRLVYGFAPAALDRRVPEAVTAPGRAQLDAVYISAIAAGTPTVVTDWATAELVKVSANAFLATKISFINAMSEIAEATGADITDLADAIGHDERIGRRFLGAGLGFGGGCLPKDIRAFGARARELGVGSAVAFLSEVDEINVRRRSHVVDLARELLGGDLRDRRIAVWGLAFKPNSDDTRDSPALDVVRLLTEAGAVVVATDPEAIENARRRLPEVRYGTLEDSATQAELVIVATEWAQYRSVDPEYVASLVAETVVLDARNCLEPEAWRAAGWTYRGLGRRPA